MSLDAPLGISDIQSSSAAINGREYSVWAHRGASIIAFMWGGIIGPPAERAYAVDPVAVETIAPSAGISQKKLLLKSISTLRRRAIAFVVNTMSLRAYILWSNESS